MKSQRLERHLRPASVVKRECEIGSSVSLFLVVRGSGAVHWGLCSDVLLAVSARMDKRDEQNKSKTILLVLNVCF